MKQFPKRKVQIGKVDMDTCGTALILGITRENEVEFIPSGQATEDDLANPNIYCIEVGGRARTNLGNFDHHGPTPPGYPEYDIHTQLSATLQAAKYLMGQKVKNPACGTGFEEKYIACRICDREISKLDKLQPIICLVRYIDLLDRFGIKMLSLTDSRPGTMALLALAGLLNEENKKDVASYRHHPPFLTDIFSGMLLVKQDPIEQFYSGVEILSEIEKRGIHPFHCMPIEELRVIQNIAIARVFTHKVWQP